MPIAQGVTNLMEISREAPDAPEFAQSLRFSPPSPANLATDARSEKRCLHCGLALPRGVSGQFCCLGCRAVHKLLRTHGLERFYALRGERGLPVPERALHTVDRSWLVPLLDRVKAGDARLECDIQGIHCTACVWLLEELFRRKSGALELVVNPAVGRVDLAVRQGFPLEEWAREVERCGYTLGPPRKRARKASDDLLIRVGITVALAANAMLFSAAMYFGLSEGRLVVLFQRLNYVAAALAVLVGGSVFIRAAWAALWRGVLHLDLPIALGIVVSFVGSSWGFFAGHSEAVYFDTITVFIALMVTGRWIQERVVERHRRFLLEEPDLASLQVTSVVNGRIEARPCSEIAPGDLLLIHPGGVFPVQARLADSALSCSLEWIDGEAFPRVFEPHSAVPAGAFNVGAKAALAEALEPFTESPLRRLLATPDRAQAADEERGVWWRRLSATYAGGVLTLAASAFSVWAFLVGDVPRALSVTTAVLVVTCPCAFGIATPLAYEMALVGLRRLGVFVRRRNFLDRVLSVRQILFDKTGTLTSGKLELRNQDALLRLSPSELSILFNMVARSSHPRAQAVTQALGAFELAFDPGVEVSEEVGRGLEAVYGGSTYRLGTAAYAEARPGESASFATAEASASDLVFTVDGKRLAAFELTEQLRPAAKDEVRRLLAAGYQLSILSGDQRERVHSIAELVGIPRERALSELSPARKAAWVSAHHPEATLMVGDGVNDALAVTSALCSATPAVDHPFLASRSDFFWVNPGLESVRRALSAARMLRSVVTTNLALALTYNFVSVALALAGFMQPWLAAILMPASSLGLLGYTALRLSRRATLWK